MRAVVFHEHGSFDHIRVETIPDPEISSNQCLVRVKAVSLNGFDPMVIRGIPGLRPPLPMIPGADIAGAFGDLGPAWPSGRLATGQRLCVVPTHPGGAMGATT